MTEYKTVSYHLDSEFGKLVDHVVQQWEHRKILTVNEIIPGHSYNYEERRYHIELGLQRRFYEKIINDKFTVISATRPTWYLWRRQTMSDVLSDPAREHRDDEELTVNRSPLTDRPHDMDYLACEMRSMVIPMLEMNPKDLR